MDGTDAQQSGSRPAPVADLIRNLAFQFVTPKRIVETVFGHQAIRGFAQSSTKIDIDLARIGRKGFGALSVPTDEPRSQFHGGLRRFGWLLRHCQRGG